MFAVNVPIFMIDSTVEGQRYHLGSLWKIKSLRQGYLEEIASKQ